MNLDHMTAEEQRDWYREELAVFASLARRMMDLHPGCVTCMERGTKVLPGKFCPDCGWHQKVSG